VQEPVLERNSAPRQTWNCHRSGATYLRDFYVLVAQHAGESDREVDEAVQDLLTAARRHVGNASFSAMGVPPAVAVKPSGSGGAALACAPPPTNCGRDEDLQRPDVGGDPATARDQGRKRPRAASADGAAKRRVTFAADPLTDEDLEYLPLDFAL
jgi:hypothetical protein